MNVSIFDILSGIDFSVSTMWLSFVCFCLILCSCVFVAHEISSEFEVVAPEGATSNNISTQQQPLDGFFGVLGYSLFGYSVEPIMVPEGFRAKIPTWSKSSFLIGKEHDGLFDFEPQWFTQIKENLADIRAAKNNKHKFLYNCTGV